MYYDYFGLKQPPFRITPDTSLFYPGGDRGAVLDALIYAIINGEGMVKVVGEVGSGKTMLCRMLEKELPEKVEVVYLANPSLSPENILHAIAFELKLDVGPDTSRLQVMHNLQEYLLKRHSEDRQVVVFVEEAQAMPIATLEEIRLLSNLETQQSKLLQIVLFGQPELDELIANPEIRQLKERITYSFQLNPFVSEHIRDYVNTRLRASGYRSGEVFDKGAIRKIERYSRGLLRRVNILADKALLAAYAANTNLVTAKHVKQAARDSEFITSRQNFLWAGLATASVLLVLLALTAVWYTRQTNVNTQHLPENKTGSVNASVLSETPEQAQSETQIKMPESNEEITAGERLVDENAEKTISYGEITDELELSLDDTIHEEETLTPLASLEQDVTDTGPDSDLAEKPLQEITSGQRSAAIEGKILDLSMLFELQDLGDERLSSQEAQSLRQQLKDLPPEVALYQDSAQFSDICKLCWSILYRPVSDPENL